MTENQRTIAGCIGLVILTILIILAIHFWITTTHSEEVVVSVTTWLHNEQIENYTPRHYTDWASSMPGDAYNTSCYRAVRYYRTVDDDDTCTGSGSKRICHSNSHQEAVYATKCDYTADRWGYERSQQTHGVNNKPTPYWATPDYTPCPQLHCERAGRNIASYIITYLWADKSSFDCTTSKEMYAEYVTGQRYIISRGTFTGLAWCETLKAKR